MSRDTRVVPHMQRLFETGSLSGLTEGQLIERFARLRDQAAFELLVERHGPMVLGVCRRILNNPNDVDDAFQATFLVLIRRSSSLGPGDVLAAWLHGVAVKVARRARWRRERLSKRERTGQTLEAPAPAPRAGQRELRAVLDREIDGLPWKYRAPIALCYLEGLTHEEAARQLGWPIGTVKGRLSRARTLLAARLTRRGITSAAGAGVGALVLDAPLQAAPSESLVAAAVRASTRIADGGSWDIVVSTSIAELVRGVVSAMLFTKVKFAAALLLVSGLAVAGAGVLGPRQAPGDDPSPVEPPSTVASEVTPPSVDEPPNADPKVKPSPPSRDNADTLQQRMAEAADRTFRSAFDEYQEDQKWPDRVYRASRLVLDARRDVARSWQARVAAYEGHLERMNALARVEIHQRNGQIKTSSTADEVRAFQAEAALWVAKSQSGQPIESSTPRPESSADIEKTSPATVAILAKLENPLPMNFPDDTPLEDVLKYIQQATQGAGYDGIPIYIDPIGLSEAEKTMTSPISIDLANIPLRRTLQLLLKQLGLIYFVDDGLLVITSESSEAAALPPTMAKPSPLLEKQEKARRGELGAEEIDRLIDQIKKLNEMEDLLKVDESGRRASASAISTEQAAALIERMKELTEAMKDAHKRPQEDGAN